MIPCFWCGDQIDVVAHQMITVRAPDNFYGESKHPQYQYFHGDCFSEVIGKNPGLSPKLMKVRQ